MQVSSFLLPLDSPEATLEQVGGKGASLARLAAGGLPVPPGFHIATTAYCLFVKQNHLDEAILSAAAEARADDPATLDHASAQIQSLITQGTVPAGITAAIREGYAGLGEGDTPVAVRSSATAEDLPGMSFAGQQETYLNVRGADSVLEAVQRCWASLWTARALGYRARQGISPAEVSLAVIVQQLVPADAAGVLFTANPISGAREQMVINASWGLGEAIVGGQVTPDSLTVCKQTGDVVSQEIANKAVMTVRSPEGTREEPVPAEKRSQPALSAPQAAELARLGAQIELLYGQPMDIEWALRGERLFILQARPITALPEPPVTLDWTLPNPKKRYARGSVTELLPDPISPLFATLGLPLWNDAMRRLMGQLGLEGSMSEMPLVAINDYVYYEFCFNVLDAVKFLLIMRKIFHWLSRADVRWSEEARPQYAKTVEAWTGRDLGVLPAAKLLDGVREIVDVAASHYLTIQGAGILPAAYISEMLFTSAYNRLLKRKDDPPALTFMLGFDSAPIQAEKSLYDLAMWAHTQPAFGETLTNAASETIAVAYRSGSAPFEDPENWREFCRRMAEHLSRFGHAIYDLDFAKSLPVEDPAPILEALKYFLTGRAQNPHVRQAAAASARERAMQSLLARRNGLRLRMVLRLVRWAQRYAPLREDALADIGLGWPPVHRILREVGRRLVMAGVLSLPEDLYWLRWDELVSAACALDAEQSLPVYAPVVAARSATWERERRVTPPVSLPINRGMRILGIDFSHFASARTDQAVGNTIKGVGASPGRVVKFASVIHGPEEFSQMRQGDILVAKITTPAWTPLFALAAGIVTDVGGPLSHSSIVAREYHIPAVLGTGVATERIRSGQKIAVDGDKGIVTLET